MRQIGSPPGANTFRLAMMVILVVSLIAIFFFYTDSLRSKTEKASIRQTTQIVNSTLAVIFATYAVKGSLKKLNELSGANPFEFMDEYGLTPLSYKGVIGDGDIAVIQSGWYFDESRKEVLYKYLYVDKIIRYSVVLEYQDMNKSGIYEPGVDIYQGLFFKKIVASV